jgi:hypothetical protein
LFYQPTNDLKLQVQSFDCITPIGFKKRKEEFHLIEGIEEKGTKTISNLKFAFICASKSAFPSYRQGHISEDTDPFN